VVASVVGSMTADRVEVAALPAVLVATRPTVSVENPRLA